MSQFYDQASLVMVPSGYKDGKLYSQKPLSTSGELSFSRGSDIEATRVNANGYIEKAQVNYIKYSNTFTNAIWQKGGATLTTGQADPFGGSNATKLDLASGANNFLFQGYLGSTNVRAQSIWMRADSAVIVGLGDGVTGEEVNVTTSWQRFEVFNSNHLNGGIQVDNYLGLTTPQQAITVYVYGAQVNEGLVAQDYQETTTAAVVNGITDNMPRLNYDPANPTCPSLLLEPSRTNFESHSEYLNAAAVKDNVVISSNATTSPEGVNNATNVVDNSTSGLHRFYSVPSTTAASGATITHSIFAKADSHSWFQLSSGGQTNDQWANFDLANGVVGNSSASANADIQPMGNGWYRCIINSTTSATNALVATLPTLTNNTNTATRSPSYVGSGGGVFLYGLQIEIGSYPTSYIPTYGSSATRTADGPSGTSTTALGGGSVGSLYIEDTRNFIDTSLTGSAFQLLTSADNEEVRFHFDAPLSQVRFRDANNSYADIGGAISVTAGVKYKALFVSDGVTAKVFANGAQVGSDYSASVWDFDKFVITNKSHSVHQCIYFDSALSDADAITLTSL